MSSRVCAACSMPGALTSCNFCQKSVCSDCFELHIDSHTFITTLDPQGRRIKVPIPICSFDTAPAVGISADLSYVCEAHSKDKEVFPLDQAQFLIDHQDQGVEILRRAKKIDQVCAHLREVPNELERTILESVERDCELVTFALVSAKANIVTEIQRQIAEFRADLSKILARLEAQKLQPELTGPTKLEEMVSTFPLEELMENLHKEQWFRYSCDRETARNIQKNYLGLRRSETLLYKPLVECAWKDDYYCLPGRPFQIFSLLEEKVFSCGAQVDFTRELMWTIVPDGSFFFCGDVISTACRLLDSDYSEYKRIGELVSVRANPGIIHFEGAIYVIGGHHVEVSLKSIEAFNLQTCKSMILPVQTQAPRSHFCPCVWNRQIFLGPANGTCVLEVFDPISNLCQIVNAGFLPISSVLVPANDEEIIILEGHVVRYLPNELRRVQLSEIGFGVYSPGGVVVCRGKAYFAAVYGSFWKICCLEEDSRVKEITKVFF